MLILVGEPKKNILLASQVGVDAEVFGKIFFDILWRAMSVETAVEYFMDVRMDL